MTFKQAQARAELYRIPLQVRIANEVKRAQSKLILVRKSDGKVFDVRQINPHPGKFQLNEDLPGSY